jgi:hypothetical protein
MEFITNNWEQIVFIFTGIVTVASAIAALTPSDKDDKFIAKIVNLFALNIDRVKKK